MNQVQIPITFCGIFPPSFPLSLCSPFFPFMGSETFIGYGDQKGFTEVASLKSHLKDSFSATFSFKVNRVEVRCGISYFWLPFTS